MAYTKQKIIIKIHLNDLIKTGRDGFFIYAEEAAIYAGLLPDETMMCSPVYTLLGHEGNEMTIQVDFEVSE